MNPHAPAFMNHFAQPPIPVRECPLRPHVIAILNPPDNGINGSTYNQRSVC
ncbi:MAG TPA: hypothetical protein VH500_11105 [Nitrososphaeraceae archaeon]